jgi:hypothetical protein
MANEQAQANRQQPPRGNQQQPRGNGEVDPAQILEHGKELWREARGLASTAEEAFEEIEVFLREQLDRRPYVTLAAASGVGYILGGGLPSRLTGLLVGWGARLALANVMQQLTAAATQGPAGAATPADGETR